MKSRCDRLIGEMDYGYHLKSRSVLASNCIAKLGSWGPDVTPPVISLEAGPFPKEPLALGGCSHGDVKADRRNRTPPPQIIHIGPQTPFKPNTNYQLRTIRTFAPALKFLRTKQEIHSPLLSQNKPTIHHVNRTNVNSPSPIPPTPQTTNHKPPKLTPSSSLPNNRFIAIKPDGVQRGLIGPIITRFEQRGYKLVAIKLVTAPKSLLEEHYADLSSKPFYPGLVAYMGSGPVCAMVWEGRDAVKTGRGLLGATNPLASAPGTIRGDYAIVSFFVCRAGRDVLL